VVGNKHDIYVEWAASLQKILKAPNLLGTIAALLGGLVDRISTQPFFEEQNKNMMSLLRITI